MQTQGNPLHIVALTVIAKEKKEHSQLLVSNIGVDNINADSLVGKKVKE